MSLRRTGKQAGLRVLLFVLWPSVVVGIWITALFYFYNSRIILPAPSDTDVEIAIDSSRPRDPVGGGETRQVVARPAAAADRDQPGSNSGASKPRGRMGYNVTTRHPVHFSNPSSYTHPAPDEPSDRYLLYHPHSGLHNQRQSLENAILVSLILNRTLVVAPAVLGDFVIPFHEFRILQLER
ncbi:hypothetical protein HK101_006574, partial [Irineochytrium annulatum]